MQSIGCLGNTPTSSDDSVPYATSAPPAQYQIATLRPSTAWGGSGKL